MTFDPKGTAALALVRARTVSVLDYAGADPSGATASDAAFTAAAATGKSVYIPRGTYKLSAHFTIKSGLRLFGDGWGSKITGGDATGLLVFDSAVDDVEIRDLWLHGTVASYGAVVSLNSDLSNIRLRNLKITDSGVFSGSGTTAVGNLGIILVADTSPTGINDFAIDNCLLLNNGGMGMTVQNHGAGGLTQVQNVRMRGCRVVGSGATSGSASGLLTAISYSGKMRGCVVDDCTIDGSLGVGIEFIGPSYSWITGNRIFAPAGRPMQLANTTPMAGNTIKGNTVIGGPTTTEVYLASSAYTLIEGNFIDLRASAGVLYLAGTIAGSGRNAVRGNTVLTAGNYALMIDGLPNNTITDNMLDNSAAAANYATLRFYGAACTGNIAHGNQIARGTGGLNWDQAGGAANNFNYNVGLLGITNGYTVQNAAGEFEGTSPFATSFTVPAASGGVPGTVTQTVTLARSALGMLASSAYSVALPAGVIVQAAAGTGSVAVTFFNWGASAATVAAGTLTARVRANGGAMI